MSDHLSNRYCNKCEKNWSSKNFATHYKRCSKSLEIFQKCELFIKCLTLHSQRTLCDQSFIISAIQTLYNSVLNVTFVQEHFLSSVEAVLQKLYKYKTKTNEKLYKYKTKTNETLINWIQEKKWYHICNISSDVKELWSEIFSRLFSASQYLYHKADTHSNRLSIFIKAWCAAFNDISSELSNRQDFYQIHDMHD
jgi:hypothetical protein